MNRGWKLADDEYNRRWIARVLANTVRSATGCFEWQGFLHPSRGYAATSYRSKNGPAHRLMYQVIHGVTLGRWEFVCHSCDNRRCVNIEHLWVGSANDNNQDMVQKRRTKRYTITHCKQGHEFTPENTYQAPKWGFRSCLACQRAHQKKPEHIAWRREYQRRRRALKKLKQIPAPIGG